MAGIYLHIPFCKQACHYCDFHFSTSLQLKEPLLLALEKEIISRKNELNNEEIETIYFGGGTPSILKTDELKRIIETLYVHYPVSKTAEITLEANPDDLTKSKIKELVNTSINRFSIGVQSFHNEDLLYMNRAHNASEAETAIKASQDSGFENITIDLIYGTPTLTEEGWLDNLRKTVSFNVPHISCYALTVEDKTPLASLIQRKKMLAVDEIKVTEHFSILVKTLSQEGFEQYEISNLAKTGYRSKHNSSYWHGKPYLGLGPGAHSFNGLDQRRWNVANNAQYIQKINSNETYFDHEVLSLNNRFNEYIMTHLRLIEGVQLKEIEQKFGLEFATYVLEVTNQWDKNWYAKSGNSLILSNSGKIISDRLASDLFKI